MKLARTGMAIVLVSLVIISSGCSIVNRVRAKNELNEAARAYREAHFEDAEAHSRRAQELDPDNKTAPLFIARIVHRQYRRGVNTPENLAKAQQAIDEYKKILEKDPTNDEAYKAIADLYGELKQTDLQRQWILKRANDTQADPEKRAEAFVILASQDWRCSNEITDLPANKITTVTNNRAVVSYKMPKDPKDFNTARTCTTRGLEQVENAIKFDPVSESAWSFKTNLLLEASKLAEMEGKNDVKAQLDKQRETAQKKTEELSAANQKKKEEEAKKTASPPAG